VTRESPVREALERLLATCTSNLISLIGTGITTGEDAPRLTTLACLQMMIDHRGDNSPSVQPGGDMAKARRTTHRSRAGKKLYAVRDKSGRFKDIQTYERSHRADLAKKSKAEIAAAKKKAAKKKPVKKAAKKKKTVKKAAKKR
jgi:hypothetical protein